MRRKVLSSSGMLAGLSLCAPAALAQSERVETLISATSPVEKAGQLSCFPDFARLPDKPINPDHHIVSAQAQLNDVRAGKVGMLFAGVGAASRRRLQNATLPVSLEQALRARGIDVTAVPGSEVERAVSGGIGAAVAAARAADIVLLAVGESVDMSGEGKSRTDIVFQPAQMALAEAVALAGKPVVVLLRHGRALALGGAVKNARRFSRRGFSAGGQARARRPDSR